MPVFNGYVKQLVESMGGIECVAKELGETVMCVHSWVYRNRVSPKGFHGFVEMATKNGIAVNTADLFKGRPKSEKKRTKKVSKNARAVKEVTGDNHAAN